MELQHSEQLQEALLRLERSRQQERRLREESDAILRGLSKLVGASRHDEVLSILYETFRQLVDCNHCWVMREENGQLVSDVTPHVFPVFDSFARVLDGDIVNAFDVSRIPEWQAIPVNGIRSALHLPMHLPGRKGMLILTHPSKIFYRDSIEIVQRVIPFAEQVTGKLELIRLGHQKELEAQRAQSLESMRKLSRAIEQTGEGVIITDDEGTIEYVNPSFSAITGYPTELVAGKSPHMLAQNNMLPAFCDSLGQTISGGEIRQTRIIEKRRDGTEFPALMTISPIMNENDEITHYVGIQQDMTAHEILEEKFRQVQKMEALGTLVGGIAHDFNNMLAGITGNLYLAKNRLSGESNIAENLDNAEKLCFRAASMIQQLLTFARKGTIAMHPFGLTSFVREVCKLSRTSIPENIRFQCRTCNDEIVVKGDTTQLQQVIMNLLSNARDAVSGIDDPSITLEVDVFRADATFRKDHPDALQEMYAHLIVSDNGPGISDCDRKHIFEPFYTTKGVGSGTGLGLSMVYGAIQSHRGIIDLETASGKGAAFHIYLPMLEEKHIVFTPVAPAATTARGNGELILVVDDNPDVRNNSKAVLEHLGYRVLEASDGLDAVEKFDAHMDTISLVIMDIVMPRLGGVKAAERIREVRPDAKVILSTGYDKNETINGELPSGGYIVLSKPYNIDDLSREIRKQIDEASS